MTRMLSFVRDYLAKHRALDRRRGDRRREPAGLAGVPGVDRRWGERRSWRRRRRAER